MPRPLPVEPFVAHLSRLPRSLDADLRRIALSEGVSVAELEREVLAAAVRAYGRGVPLAALPDLEASR